MNYTPIVTATTSSRGGSNGSAMQLSIQCRGGRTELVVAGPAVSRSSADYAISYRVNDGQPVQLAAGSPSFGTGVAFTGDIVRLLQSLPEEGEHRRPSLHPDRCGPGRVFFARRTEDGAREGSRGVQMAARRCQAIATNGQLEFDYGRYMMMKFGNAFRTSAAILVALLIVVPPSAAQVEQKQPAKQKSKRPAVDKKLHHLVLQVNTNEPATMNLALNNATNVAQYYKDLGEKVAIEVVTFGPGLHMLRNDTSPVKARIETLALSTPEISFKACGNTQQNMQKAENKDIPIIPAGDKS